MLKKVFIKTIMNTFKIIIPVPSWRKKLRSIIPSRYYYEAYLKESELVHRYLDGLNGIEIGASTQNSFGLDKTAGAYANVDYSCTVADRWQGKGIPPAKVNIVASGDNLPFKDKSLDYIFSSHVIEHFFDPIKTINEWLRVIKPGGYIVMIIPHKNRTFDKNRDVTSVSELQNRHEGKLTMNNYIYKELEEDLSSDVYRLIQKEEEIPNGWTKIENDPHHHWSVWTTESFLELCKNLNLNIEEYNDIDDKIGNGFTFILKK